MTRILFSIFLSLPLLLQAMNGFYQIGYGTQSKGMGGVGIALPQDTLAAAHNPAGMALLGCRFDADLDWLMLDGNAHIRGSAIDEANRGYSSNRHVLFPEMGLNYMFCPCISVGVSLYMNGLTDVDFGRSLPLLGTSDLSFSYYQYIFAPSISWIINCNHSVGFALNIASNWLEAEGFQSLAADSVHPTDVTNRGGESQWGVGFSVGWLGHFCNTLSVGVAYKSRIWTSRFVKYRGLLADGGSFDTPHSIGAGVAYHPWCCLVISSDIEYILWGGPKTFGNGSNTDRNFGESDGPGLAWEGQFVFKLGMALDLNDCLTLRGGYNYGSNPIDDSDKFGRWANIKTLAVERHHLTVGLTYAWCWSELSLAYVHGFEGSRHGAIPNDTGRVGIKRSQDQVSISYGYRF